MRIKIFTTLVVLLAVVAGAGIGYTQCSLVVPSFTPSPLSPVGGMACPQGDGDPAVQTWLDSAKENLVLTAVIRDSGSIPIPNMSRFNMYVRVPGGCNCGATGDSLAYFVADSDTDINGETTFTVIVAPGSISSDVMIELVLGGTTVCATAAVDFGIQFNSADFNCDRVVDEDDRLAMIPLYNALDYSADLNQSGTSDVWDAVVLAQHRYPSHVCP